MKAVVAAVIERNGTYLICQRPAHKRHGGLWEFPGGKLEDDESLLEAARRELAEELELEVTSETGLLFSVHDHDSGYMINFLAVESIGEPKLLEHSALAWLSRAELLNSVLAPSDRKFAEHLNAGKTEI